MEACAQWANDSEAIRKAAVNLAAEEAAKSEPDQVVLHSLAQIEESVRRALNGVGCHPLTLVYRTKKPDSDSKA